jgi:hypothetical protein
MIFKWQNKNIISVNFLHRNMEFLSQNFVKQNNVLI